MAAKPQTTPAKIEITLEKYSSAWGERSRETVSARERPVRTKKKRTTARNAMQDQKKERDI
jgi:hypothetical protein